jgi:integrase
MYDADVACKERRHVAIDQSRDNKRRGSTTVNRPYVYRGREVAGVYQRCTAKCVGDTCSKHKWQFEVELPGVPGAKRERITKSGFATAKEASDARAEVIRKHKQGTLSGDRKMMLGTWLPKWLDARAERGELRFDTIADYRDSIDRYLIPRLGHFKLTDLRAAHITAAYDAMRRDRTEAIKEAEAINVQRRAEAAAKNAVKHSGRPRVPHLVPVPRPLGPATMKRINNTLSGALRSAVRGGLIPVNPAPDAELAPVVAPRIEVWTADQLGAFLDAIEGKRLYPLYHLAAFAGMRRGELCGISWDDVELDEKTGKGRITVRWQITDKNYRAARQAERRGERGRFRTKPKTRAGDARVVDLDVASVTVLVAWRYQQAKEAEDWGRAYVKPADADGTPYNLVFTRENGAPLDPGQTYSHFIKLVEDAGLSHLALHGLRHINISLQLDAGVSESVIAMRVGHTSPSLIRSTYGHLIGTVGQRAAEATASLVPRKGKAEPAAPDTGKRKKAKKSKKSKKGDDGLGGVLAKAS